MISQSYKVIQPQLLLHMRCIIMPGDIGSHAESRPTSTMTPDASKGNVWHEETAPPQGRIFCRDEDGSSSFVSVQGKPGCLRSMFRLGSLQIPNHHMGTANGLYLEQVVPDG